MKIMRSIAKYVLAIAVFAAAFCASGCTEIPPLTDGELSRRVAFNCSFDLLEVGEQRRYWVDIKPKGSIDDLVLTSSDTSVATIDENGIVTALAAGKTEITASSEKTASRDSFSLEVFDAIIFADEEQGAESLVALAADDKPKSVALSGDFSVPVYVKCNMSITARDRAELLGAVVESGASLSAKGVVFRAGSNGTGVVVEEGANLSCRSCAFVCDPSEQDKTACEAMSGFASCSVDECDFAGFGTAVSVHPSDGEISFVNNVFSDCLTAVVIDVALPDDGTNADMRGCVRDNIFAECDKSVSFSSIGSFNGDLRIEYA